ncbi:hypothetical protein [Vibrio gazogenes]|uniref:Chemotaxis protein n=1 Tax=Vibrio gazogenes TaxID=687 RepID=A0A1Z2SBB6_VIBGA|nr:hypothetical protein [Vibrio gazogenes]ASA54421.1 hypothetical protein BSQ33_00885 [Vibrio gazogenes]ASA58353.1 hypothetical protein BSQ33_21470 [Vibrio gazogenes]
MGKGGSSSSSTTNNNTNINGTNAVQGDNLGVLISGVQGSVGNITMTDQGATKTAGKIAEEALNLGGDTVSAMASSIDKTLDSNTKVSKAAFDFGEESLKGALSASNKSLDKMESVSESAMSALKSMASQSNESARAALTMAGDAKQREQIGNATEWTKVAYAICAVLAIGAVAYAIVKGSK